MGTKFDFSAHFTHFSSFKNRQNFVISFSIILSNNNIKKTNNLGCVVCGYIGQWSYLYYCANFYLQFQRHTFLYFLFYSKWKIYLIFKKYKNGFLKLFKYNSKTPSQHYKYNAKRVKNRLKQYNKYCSNSDKQKNFTKHINKIQRFTQRNL